MAFDYLSLRDVDVPALLEEFGMSVALKKSTTGAYNPSTSAAAVTTSNKSVVAVELQIDKAKVNGSTIVATDRRFYMSANGGSVVPEPNDIITLPTKEVLRVTDVLPLAPAGVAVLFDVYARGQ
jgi:hypothetical protein